MGCNTSCIEEELWSSKKDEIQNKFEEFINEFINECCECNDDDYIYYNVLYTALKQYVYYKKFNINYYNTWMFHHTKVELLQLIRKNNKVKFDNHICIGLKIKKWPCNIKI